MEFERALFRIHQRTLAAEGLRKARVQAERVLPWAIAAFGILLVMMHAEYVGRAKCLPMALKRAGLWNVTEDAPEVPYDVLLSVGVADVEYGPGLGEEKLLDGLQLRMAPGGAARAPSPGGVSVATESWRVLGSVGSAEDATRVRYRFAFDREIILMRQAVLEAHNFSVLNLTLQESCLASSRVLKDVFRIFDVYDNLIINELAYTFRSRGYLERYDGDVKVEAWTWSADQVEVAAPREGRSLAGAAVRKALLMSKALFAVLLISSITGFFIRVAVNGSAVLMFPIAIAASRWGTGRMSIGLLTRSFPWIGVHVEVLRQARRPLWPLFRSHLVFLFLQSFAYLSCNLAWRFILYRKSSPEAFEERVFSFCSLIELFNLIFVRSSSSTAVFPLLACACMVYLHFYIFCSLYPFHMLAFGLCSSVCLYGMAYCLNHFEEPALRGDPHLHTTPTALHPRATYMPQLSPSWTLEAAPLWTMFYPTASPSSFPDEALRHLASEEYLIP